VQDVLLDRLVWFLRNADLSQGLEDLVEHYRAGIVSVEASLDDILPSGAQAVRRQRAAALTERGVPEATALRLANLPALLAAPDIVLISDRAGKPADQVAATYFAVETFFQLDRIAAAAREIAVSDYFDRLALDRALDSIGDSERRLTAAMLGRNAAGPQAVEAWVTPRKAHVERTRASIHEIAASGLTLSKVSVAASLLGDLAGQK